MSFYGFSAKSVAGTKVDFSVYAGKVCLVVNVASKWGYTQSDYSQLQDMYERLEGRGLRILAFPCNQFAEEEPGSDREIEEFAVKTYGVRFDLFSKIDVNGGNSHEFYGFLKSLRKGGAPIEWNFEKFLFDRKGNFVKNFSPDQQPKTFEKDIVALL